MSQATQPPVRIGQYRLSKTLGIGSFGKVKLATHERTGYKVAVKILNRAKIKKLDMQEKVRREIANLKKLSHPHIIRLYEVVHTPSDIFVIIEYVSGGELFDYIVQKGRLSEQEARNFFQQIIAGVEYCHYHGVVHRDLKPENLLLDEDHNVKIADFGLSNCMEDGQFLRTSCGSPNYAAPEVISGYLYAGPEVDIWSCGVILYALLCGSLPFDDESIAMLFKKIKSGSYNLPTHLSDTSKDLLSRMLVVDPLKRITLPEIRQHPWFRSKLPLYLSITPQEAEAEMESLAAAQAHRRRVGLLPSINSMGNVNEPSERQGNTSLRLNGPSKPLDPEILEQVLKLGYPGLNSIEDVERAARSNGRPAWNDVGVAYELLADRKLAIERSQQRRAQSEVLQSSPNSNQFPADAMISLDSSHHHPSESGVQPVYALAAETPLGAEFRRQMLAHLRSQEEANAARRRRWYLGIQSKKEPAHVMSEVTRALKAGGFKWRISGPYKLVAKWIPPLRGHRGAYDLTTGQPTNPSSSLGSQGGAGSLDGAFLSESDVDRMEDAREKRGSGFGIEDEDEDNDTNSALSSDVDSDEYFDELVRSAMKESDRGLASNANTSSDPGSGLQGISSNAQLQSLLSSESLHNYMISARARARRRAAAKKNGYQNVRLLLQLYKIQRGVYLLDLQREAGDVFSFMSLCARLITELKVPAAAAAVQSAVEAIPSSLNANLSGSAGALGAPTSAYAQQQLLQQQQQHQMQMQMQQQQQMLLQQQQQQALQQSHLADGRVAPNAASSPVPIHSGAPLPPSSGAHEHDPNANPNVQPQSTQLRVFAVPSPVPGQPPQLYFLNPNTGAREPLPVQFHQQALQYLRSQGQLPP